MVNARLGKDLESFGAPILVLGDRVQLPPKACRPITLGSS
jgi:hypothetical protein